jgi:hypothetical protein
MKKFALSVSVLAALACFSIAGTADAGPGWRYTNSHGMKHCAFAAHGPGGATVNTATTASGNGGISITGEQGKTVTFRLICERLQSYDDQGQLISIGSEGTYTGPGTGVSIGVDKPDDASGNGYKLPKGREWTVNVGDAPATYQLGWTGSSGSDSISVTVAVVAPPPTMPQVTAALNPVQQKADDAYKMAESSGHGWQNRVFAFQGQYTIGLDSLNNDGDARQGYGFDANVLIGSDPHVRFLTGLNFRHDFRQKPLVAAPNMPVNGFNQFIDWQTIFVGPKAGVEWMPVGWFQLQAWASLGALVSIDGTVPLSQLPDRTLYSGESSTTGALGYNVTVQPGFVIAERFVIGANIGILGNLTKVAKERGPEQVCNQTTGDCLVQRKGWFLDVPLGFFAGFQY